MSDVPDNLLDVALSEPRRALALGEQRLGEGVGPAERSAVERAMGNAYRELREMERSRSALLRAVASAREANAPSLEGLALMSLAATESYAGRFDVVFDTMDRAEDLLTGDDLVLALNQRAGLLQRAGRTHEALSVFTKALDLAPNSGIPWVEGSLRLNRGVLYGYQGRISEAIEDTTKALAIFEAQGWAKRAADMVHNLAWLAGRRGDIVEALRLFEDADARHVGAGVAAARIYPDLCETLMIAGLYTEAVRTAERSVGALRTTGSAIDLGEALLLRARAALAMGDVDGCSSSASEAAGIFIDAQRQGWTATAELLMIDAKLTNGTVDGRDLVRSADLERDLSAAGLDVAATSARLVAADVANVLGASEHSEDLLASIDAKMLDPVGRSRFADVRARQQHATGDTARALTTCEEALTAAEDELALLGGTELRRLVGQRVQQLLRLGLHIVAGRSEPRELLCWAERVRASSLAYPPIRPPADEVFAVELDHLRAAIADLHAREADGRADPDGRRRVQALRRTVQRHARLASGERSERFAPSLDVDGLLAATTAGVLIEMVVIDDHLVNLVLGRGHVSVRHVGPVEDVMRAAALLRAAVNRLLRTEATELSTRLLATAAADFERASGLAELEAPSVLSPLAFLQAVPWGFLPSLVDQPFAMAPSAASWLRAHRQTRSGSGTVLVAGPQLEYADVEVRTIAQQTIDAVVLSGPAATAKALAEHLPGMAIGHFACHGDVAGDHPMFASLRLSDGPLCLYDLERIDRPPPIMVLSACQAGLAADHPGEELTGFSASLLSMGVRSVVASAVSVPDRQQLVDAMTSFHRAVAAGSAPSEALVVARRTAPETARAFVCLGAG